MVSLGIGSRCNIGADDCVDSIVGIAFGVIVAGVEAVPGVWADSSTVVNVVKWSVVVADAGVTGIVDIKEESSASTRGT